MCAVETTNLSIWQVSGFQQRLRFPNSALNKDFTQALEDIVKYLLCVVYVLRFGANKHM